MQVLVLPIGASLDCLRMAFWTKGGTGHVNSFAIANGAREIPPRAEENARVRGDAGQGVGGVEEQSSNTQASDRTLKQASNDHRHRKIKQASNVQ